jgi:hypothetical protein
LIKFLSSALLLLFCATPAAVEADLVLGTSAAGLPNNPDLIYNSLTGNVQIAADGAEITSFAWQNNAGMFNPPADFSDLDNDVLPGVPTETFDNKATNIGWTSALATANMGFDGPSLADLGNIFPVGLTEAGVHALLNINDWGGPGGAGGDFDVVAVPELNAFLYMLVASSGFALILRCRRLWRGFVRT